MYLNYSLSTIVTERADSEMNFFAVMIASHASSPRLKKALEKAYSTKEYPSTTETAHYLHQSTMSFFAHDFY